ncbi:MAG: DNA polymerase III subunit delta [Deltaproteobacteria bacterium]|nr:DNA polymerase III subunit delta [Deltaproteobacteria bacterium]
MTKAENTEAFLKVLEKGTLPAVVAFGGDERIFVDEALVAVRTRVLSGGLADFNHDRVSARERGAGDVVNLCRTLPVMAPRRLVEVRDADAIRDADVDVLAGYLERPCPETVLCLVLDEIDERVRLPKLLAKAPAALICRFDHPKGSYMPDLVQSRAQRSKVGLQPGAAEALARMVGNDLTLLARALEKLALAVNGDVSVEDVGRHVADTHMEDVYAWARAVATGDRDGALRAMAALQAAREEPLGLVGLLAWQLREVATARALLDEGKDAARELRLSGDRAGPVLHAARLYEPAQHAARLVRLADADRTLKSSRQPQWLQMVRLVQDLTAPPRTTRAGASTTAQGRRPSG